MVVCCAVISKIKKMQAKQLHQDYKHERQRERERWKRKK